MTLCRLDYSDEFCFRSCYFSLPLKSSFVALATDIVVNVVAILSATEFARDVGHLEGFCMVLLEGLGMTCATGG